MSTARRDPERVTPFDETVEAAPAPVARLAGKRLGPYRIESAIGRGGMGVVYKAIDTTLERPVAIKVLPPHLAEDKSFVKRFVREARACARLNHSGIVQVYQAGRMGTDNEPGPCFIAMEYVDAEPLSDLVARKGPLAPKRALKIAGQVAEALAIAHEAGVVHRDIKSGNVLVGAGGRAKILDFGLASLADAGNRITRTGAYVGTPEYSSPEQCELGEVDARSDLYSLGVVLYEMLTGEVPFSAPTPLALFHKIVHEAPPPLAAKRPDLPRAVARLVGRLLEKDPARRVGSARELLTEIHKARAAIGAAGTGTRRALAVRRRKRTAGLARTAAIALVLALAGAAGALLALRGGEPARDDGPASQAMPAPVAPAGPVRIAVLDFEDASGRADLAWYRVGLAEMVITDLAQNGRVEVLPRERVRRAAAHGAGAAETGRRAGAQLVLEGRYVQVGSRVRLDLRVLDAAEGRLVAARKVAGPAEEIFALVDAVTKEVTTALEGAGLLPQPETEPAGDGALLRNRAGKEQRTGADRPVAEVLLLGAPEAKGQRPADASAKAPDGSDAAPEAPPSRLIPSEGREAIGLAGVHADRAKANDAEKFAAVRRSQVESSAAKAAPGVGGGSPRARLAAAVRERTLGQMLLEKGEGAPSRRAFALRALRHLERARSLAPRLARVDALIERAEAAARE